MLFSGCLLMNEQTSLSTPASSPAARLWKRLHARTRRPRRRLTSRSPRPTTHSDGTSARLFEGWGLHPLAAKSNKILIISEFLCPDRLRSRCLTGLPLLVSWANTCVYTRRFLNTRVVIRSKVSGSSFTSLNKTSDMRYNAITEWLRPGAF